MAAMKDRLYEERKKHGLSQEDVARKLDVSAKAVSKWETGESQPTLDNMAKLSDLYQQSVDYLLGKEATPSVSATGPVPSPAAKPQRFGFFFLPLVMSLLAIALFILYSPVFAIIHVTSGVGGLTGDLGTTSFDSYHLFLGSSDWFHPGFLCRGPCLGVFSCSLGHRPQPFYSYPEMGTDPLDQSVGSRTGCLVCHAELWASASGTFPSECFHLCLIYLDGHAGLFLRSLDSHPMFDLGSGPLLVVPDSEVSKDSQESHLSQSLEGQWYTMLSQRKHRRLFF
jgi:transcriptional regulator with XRE-family HTH domain